MASTSAWSIAIFTLIMTLVATGVTLFILNKLLRPVIMAKEALIEFKEYSKIPDLPTKYNDEGGVLMREVQKTIESLSNIQEERENVIHILRHDLQSPINNSLSILELLKTDTLDREAIDSLETNFQIQRKRLLTSIDYIKNQKNLQARKNSLTNFSIKKLIDEAIENVNYELNAKNIEIETTHFQDKNILIPKVILDRVLTNLLDNAIKHSKANEKVIINSIVEDNLLKIQIKDFGDGIPKDVLPLLFKLNDSKRKSYNPDKPSMGLGLYLCQKLMHSVGGRILASNNKNTSGAKFTIEYILSENNK